ncbi:3-oxoacid CoA-transferase subunit B [Halobacillus mangrovi]|uniref:Succinyl-CoA--3-ketoacid-CoA transferase n=1 Tax=Halobacillus mangrovi TaxID=402384 RepID=A0A1W5ZUD6_9BACI|nr:3-oxoacid CoA-transferase subunit B [Halobacillus mangrovi]ARI76883.1 succinyl-CoA--3-ketoacid-CoA transferase [Halobacillus mangrovi]
MLRKGGITLQKILQKRVKIARRLADELKKDQVVNVGVGIPTLVPNYLEDTQVYIHSENGLLGMGPNAQNEDIDMDLISASKKPVTMIQGASLFDSSQSFAMIRGGHIDVAVLGALQVDETGEIANWAVPGERILGVGGAMDLVAGAKTIIVGLSHQAKNGDPKIVQKLTCPSSGSRKVDMVVTERAVFDVKDGKMFLKEMDPTISIEDLKKMTSAHFEVSSDLSKNY